MSRVRVVMLVGPDPTSWVVYNRLAQSFDVTRVVLENRLPARKLLARRVKKLGYTTVAGQVLFRLFVYPLLAREAKKQIVGIQKLHSMNDQPCGDDVLYRVESVNDSEVVDLLKRESPDVVVLNGTRIVSQEILAAVEVPFLNIHAGVTPLYRGVHGAWWALLRGDREHCGVTVHKVDAGIDTGGILWQGCIDIGPADNFASYPWHQIAVALPALEEMIARIPAGLPSELPHPPGESRLWSHPTAWNYVYQRIAKGVK